MKHLPHSCGESSDSLKYTESITEDQAHQIHQLIIGANEEKGVHMHTPSQEKVYEESKYGCLACLDGETVVGYARVQPVQGDTRHSINLHSFGSFVVHPGYGGQGIGSTIATHLVEARFKKIFLWTNPQSFVRKAFKNVSDIQEINLSRTHPEVTSLILQNRKVTSNTLCLGSSTLTKHTP